MVDLKYKNNVEEFSDFSMYRALKSENYKKSVARRKYLVSGMLIISGIVYCFMSRKMNEGVQDIGFAFGLMFLISGILNLFIFNKIVNRSVKKSIIKNLTSNKELLERTIKVKLDNKGFFLSRGKEKKIINKEEVLEVIELNDCLCIAIKNDPGVVIPNNSFRNEDEKEEIKQYFI